MVSAGVLQNYRLELTVNSVAEQGGSSFSCDHERSLNGFGCVRNGDVYVGRFAIDADLLDLDGINSSASIYGFHLVFGSEGFYSTDSNRGLLSGFRNGSGFANAPGFLIENNQLVDLVGGVYGLGDVPFIDMFGYAGVPRNSFAAYDGRYFAQGLMTIHRVPVPSTLALILPLLFVVPVFLRRGNGRE